MDVTWILGLSESMAISLQERGKPLLGICACPGKQVPRKGISRNIDADLADFQRRGVDQIYCLMDSFELKKLGVRDYSNKCSGRGIELVYFPIIEMQAPPDKSAARAMVCDIGRALRSQKTVIIHCRAGVGRSATLAACVLLHLGLVDSADRAISILRELRGPKAVETRTQEHFVIDYFAHYLDGVE